MNQSGFHNTTCTISVTTSATCTTCRTNATPTAIRRKSGINPASVATRFLVDFFSTASTFQLSRFNPCLRNYKLISDFFILMFKIPFPFFSLLLLLLSLLSLLFCAIQDFFHFIFVSVVESRKLRSVAPTAEISFRISLPTNFGIFSEKLRSGSARTDGHAR